MMPSFSAGILFALPRAKTFPSSHVRRYWASPLLALGLVVLAIPFTMPGRPVFAAATIFLAALAYPSVYAPRYLAATAPYIMGIYLVHALFTSAVNVALGLGPDHLLPAYFAWPTAIAIFFTSWFAVWVMRKIPVVRNFV